MKMADREKLDATVLADLGEWSHKATYVIRNALERKGLGNLKQCKFFDPVAVLKFRG